MKPLLSAITIGLNLLALSAAAMTGAEQKFAELMSCRRALYEGTETNKTEPKRSPYYPIKEKALKTFKIRSVMKGQRGVFEFREGGLVFFAGQPLISRDAGKEQALGLLQNEVAELLESYMKKNPGYSGNLQGIDLEKRVRSFNIVYGPCKKALKDVDTALWKTYKKKWGPLVVFSKYKLAGVTHSKITHHPSDTQAAVRNGLPQFRPTASTRDRENQ